MVSEVDKCVKGYSGKTNPCVYGPLIFDKDARRIPVENG